MNSTQCVGLIAFGIVSLSAQDKAIDVQRSSLMIHVGKAGLFSAAGHEHWVKAPIAAGVLNDSDPLHVEFRVEAAKMEVRPDPKVDGKTQAAIQKDMQGTTLESAVYPEIVFRSARVEKLAEGQWRVEGTLKLHGVTKPISVIVKRAGGRYSGKVSLKQTDFGIKPISAAGGTIKVKNEIEIEFDIVTRAQTSAAR